MIEFLPSSLEMPTIQLKINQSVPLNVQFVLGTLSSVFIKLISLISSSGLCIEPFRITRPQQRRRH